MTAAIRRPTPVALILVLTALLLALSSSCPHATGSTGSTPIAAAHALPPAPSAAGTTAATSALTCDAATDVRGTTPRAVHAPRHDGEGARLAYDDGADPALEGRRRPVGARPDQPHGCDLLLRLEIART